MPSKKPKEEWGGPWTLAKLQAFENYVRAYLKILNANKYWKTIYFDGFAGSGERKAKLQPGNSLFSGLELTEEQVNIYQGAAERLVRMEAPYTFNFYYFIEKNETASTKLEKKLNAIPASKQKKLVFRHSDCNEQLQKLAKIMKEGKHAALVF